MPQATADRPRLETATQDVGHLRCRAPLAGRRAPSTGRSDAGREPPPRGRTSPVEDRRPPRTGRAATTPTGVAVAAVRDRPPSTTKNVRPLRAASRSGLAGSRGPTTGHRVNGPRRRAAPTSKGARACPCPSARRGGRPHRRLPRGRAEIPAARSGCGAVGLSGEDLRRLEFRGAPVPRARGDKSPVSGLAFDSCRT
jgi:hypothetical protein